MARQSLGGAHRKVGFLDRPLLVGNRSARLVTSAKVDLVGSGIRVTNINKHQPTWGMR
jgi:hypothetical protein